MDFGCSAEIISTFLTQMLICNSFSYRIDKDQLLLDIPTTYFGIWKHGIAGVDCPQNSENQV